MENREKENINSNEQPDDSSDVSRDALPRRSEGDTSSADFGQKIGESEDMESNSRRPDRSELNH